MEGHIDALKWSDDNDSLKRNMIESSEEILNNLSLLVNKVEAGVNERMRCLVSHIPNLPGAEDEVILPDGFIEVHVILFLSSTAKLGDNVLGSVRPSVRLHYHG